jgi:hypothetical protein
MIDRYAAVIEAVLGASNVPAQAAWPVHLSTDGLEHAAGVLKTAGFPGAPTAGLWTRHIQ